MRLEKLVFNFMIDRGIRFAKNLLHNPHGVVNPISAETATLEAFFAKQGFSKAGTRLVSARKGLPISELGKAQVPNAATVDIVKVQSGFGSKTTDILSFKDEYGNLIKRHRIAKNKDFNIVEKMEGDYRISKYTKSIYGIDRSHFVGNELIKSEHIEGFDPVYKTVSEFFDRATKHTYSINYKDKFIKLSALRQTDGLKGNKIFSKLTSNCLTQDELNKLKKLKYLHEFKLSGKDFLEAISPLAMKAKRFKIYGQKTKILTNKLQANNLGRFKPGKVEIDIEQCITNKQIVNTLNHELQHVKQNEMRTILILEKFFKALGLENSFSKYIQKTFGGFSNAKRKFAQKCNSGFKSYTDGNMNFEAYYNNFVEMDARKAGEASEKEYLRQKNIYDDILYNASNRMIN